MKQHLGAMKPTFPGQPEMPILAFGETDFAPMGAQYSQEETMVDKQNLGRPTQSLNFSLQKNITHEDIVGILKELYTAAGCRTCGLLGFDIRFQVIDSENLARFQKVGHLADVSDLVGARV